ncbi:hypothetical protein BGX38DRAFT_1276021 [Terfezia claveryi]|nr:hypothetical protein BGX38DRAFT_1276021 [Terfezia claveryi]
MSITVASTTGGPGDMTSLSDEWMSPNDWNISPHPRSETPREDMSSRNTKDICNAWCRVPRAPQQQLSRALYPSRLQIREYGFLALHYSINMFVPVGTEVVEDPITNIENALLATHLPGEAYEPEIEAPPPPPLVTPLSYIEGLLLFSLQGDPSANTTALQDSQA